MTTSELPPIGSIVRFGKVRYEVVRHGCATDMKHCTNAPYPITALRITHRNDRYKLTECLPGDKVTVEES